MLIPLTRKKFEELVPPVATGDQYKFYWGKPSDVLRRLLISIAAVVVITLVRFLIGEGFDILIFSVGFSVGFYWLWGPVFLASRRNRELRQYPYSGFWEGEVLDMFISEELVGTEETVNNRGELVIVENRERCLNLEVGDDTGFYTKLQVPLKRDHRAIRPGDTAQMLVVSNRPDLSRIAQATDIYLPDCNLWVSDYPFVRRDLFVDVSRRLVYSNELDSNELDSNDRETAPDREYFEPDQPFDRDPRRSSRSRSQNRSQNRLIDRPRSGRPQPRGRRSSRGY